MIQPVTRVSPVHAALEALHPRWGENAGMAVPLDFGDPSGERVRAAKLALCDAGALERLTVKGLGAAEFLKQQGLEVPELVYGVEPLGEDGLLIRTGGSEFFLESGPRDETVRRITQALAPGSVAHSEAPSAGIGGAPNPRPRAATVPDPLSPSASTLSTGGRPRGVYPVLRQDASFLLSGTRALGVLAQTCSIDFRECAPLLVPRGGRPASVDWGSGGGGRVGSGASRPEFVMTRIAGVSCGVLPRVLKGLPVYQLWLDFSYGPYLWDQLFAIVRELDGGAAGLSCYFQEEKDPSP